MDYFFMTRTQLGCINVKITLGINTNTGRIITLFSFQIVNECMIGKEPFSMPSCFEFQVDYKTEASSLKKM